ncbi:MAG: sulfurtransferase [Fimbriimonadaceae bacterium]|nr:sulfurtransferase [Fimbriimonadaceae bacterium]
MSQTSTPEITVNELAERVKNSEPIVLLDIREPHELEISKLSGAESMPMPTVPQRYSELNKDDEIVVICRSGSRSDRVTQFLLDQGFTNVRNLKGGMNAWAAEIDTSMPQY